MPERGAAIRHKPTNDIPCEAGMKHIFLVTIDTDEATQEELEEAITDMLRAVDMPNGDTLYIDCPVVEYFSPERVSVRSIKKLMDAKETVDDAQGKPVIIDPPESIWLVYGDIDESLHHRDCHDVAWCEDQQFDSDVLYIMAR